MSATKQVENMARRIVELETEAERLREVARAARALIADREGANIGEERLALRDALARLDGPR